MKKKKIIVFLGLVTTLVLAGCSSKSQTAEERGGCGHRCKPMKDWLLKRGDSKGAYSDCNKTDDRAIYFRRDVESIN